MSEGGGHVWVLNLDAELELETAGSYTQSRSMGRLVARQCGALLGSLIAPGDVVLSGRELAEVERRALAGRPGLAWSPTPRALATLRAAGARVGTTPALEVLRKVNGRPFTESVRAPLAHGSFEKHVALDLETALALVARPADQGWLVRRCFGAAGRGRRRLRAGRPSANESSWLVASLRSGPLVIEPWVTIMREYTRSAWVAPGGEVVIAPPCFQETTHTGAWKRTESAARDEISRSDDAHLGLAVEAAGQALASAGYFGAFGIDAFRHRDPRHPGASVLNPISEINARFTMDWALGMGTRAPHR